MAWRDNTRYAVFTRRAAVLSTGTALLFGGLLVRMFHLQVSRSDEFAKLAEENRISTRLLAPRRGRILDRFGVPLAANRQNFRLHLIPEQAGNYEAILDHVIALVPRVADDRTRIMKEIKRNRRFIPVTIAENLTWDEFSAINIRAPELPGIIPDVGDTRDYPYGEELSHVVGYVAKVAEGDLDGDPQLRLPGFRIGKSGVERTVDLPLRGQPGQSNVEVNAYGREIKELSRHEGTPGNDVLLTLDMDIQTFASQRVAGQSASVVVLDIMTGDVLALVSAPGFNPNSFNIGLTSAEWRGLVDNPLKPLLNKAIAGLYPPGSTFKPVTAIAGLEAGVITPSDRVHCNGQTWLGNHAFHCWKKGGHGSMDLHLGMKHSCDIYFYEVARRTGIDKIADVAKRLGLGSDYGFELANTKSGIVPSSGWKLAMTGQAWQGGETLIAGIGQGFLLTSPLHLAVMAARLANGGKAVRPHLLRSVGAKLVTPPVDDALQIDPVHLELVRAGMNAVSNEAGGTAYAARLFDLGPDLMLAGKTGSAQVRRISMAERATGVKKNEDLPWEQRDHALFICFAPVINPRYSIGLVVEHGGSGSKSAAPVARDIMREVLIRDPARRQPLAPIASADPAARRDIVTRG